MSINNGKPSQYNIDNLGLVYGPQSLIKVKNKYICFTVKIKLFAKVFFSCCGTNIQRINKP